jgi:hypothetical protein
MEFLEFFLKSPNFLLASEETAGNGIVLLEGVRGLGGLGGGGGHCRKLMFNLLTIIFLQKSRSRFQHLLVHESQPKKQLPILPILFSVQTELVIREDSAETTMIHE